MFFAYNVNETSMKSFLIGKIIMMSPNLIHVGFFDLNIFGDINYLSRLIVPFNKLFYKLFKINIVCCISIESSNSSCLNHKEFVALIA